MKCRKKPTFVDAVQWFKQGDHPDVTLIPLNQKLSEAKRLKLGWLPTPEGGHIVFPGDWVIIDNKGRRATCNPITFKKLYEPAEPFQDNPLAAGRGDECQ
jgi:hypothetical protein